MYIYIRKLFVINNSIFLSNKLLQNPFAIINKSHANGLILIYFAICDKNSPQILSISKVTKLSNLYYEIFVDINYEAEEETGKFYCSYLRSWKLFLK